jgi:hypothetical protein
MPPYPARPCDASCLSTLTEVSRLGVTLTNPMTGAQYAPNNIIDGDLNTQAGNQQGSNQWISVRIPPSTRVGYVAIHFDDDEFLQNVQLWVGDSLGAMTGSNSRSCGQYNYVNAALPPSPLVFYCGYASEDTQLGQYVTIKQVPNTMPHYQMVSEVQIYAYTVRFAATDAPARRPYNHHATPRVVLCCSGVSGADDACTLLVCTLLVWALAGHDPHRSAALAGTIAAAALTAALTTSLATAALALALAASFATAHAAAYPTAHAAASIAALTAAGHPFGSHRLPIDGYLGARWWRDWRRVFPRHMHLQRLGHTDGRRAPSS